MLYKSDEMIPVPNDRTDKFIWILFLELNYEGMHQRCC